MERLSEGYQSVPETADVSSTGNVLPSPASKELKGSRQLSVTCAPLRAVPLWSFGNSLAHRVPPALCHGPGAS